MLDTLSISIFAIGPFVAVAIGWVLLWVAAAREITANYFVTRLLRAVGVVILVTGIFVGILISSHIMSLFLLSAALVFGISSIVKFYVAERQSLLWVLAVAAERGIPLESAARAFAEERNDVIGRRSKQLADYLEAGVPLSLALSRSRCSVTPSTLLAAELGQQTGALDIGLRQAIIDLDEGDDMLRSMIEKLFYLIFLALFGTFILTFIMLKIVPVFAKMFDEFEIELPLASQQLVRVYETVANSLISFPLLLCGFIGIVMTVLWYIGVSPRHFPIVGRLWWSADCSLIMQWLAVAVRRGLPISEMVRMLATHFPQTRVRKKLERASMRIDRGQDWCDSLRATRIFRHREGALFKSAELAGNLPWALDEMAQSGIRRSAYRIRGWINLLFPALVCVFGAVVLFVCLGTMLPLIALIQGLS